MSDARPRSGDEQAVRRWMRVLPVSLLAGAALVYLVSVPLGLVGTSNRLDTPEIVLASVLLLAATYAVVSHIYSLDDVTVGPAGVSAKLSRIDRRQQELDERQTGLVHELDALKVVVAGLLTKYERNHLAGLNRDTAYHVHFGEIFFHELERLDALGFASPLDGLRGLMSMRVYEDGLTEFDLRQFMRITDRGREYLKVLAWTEGLVPPKPPAATP